MFFRIIELELNFPHINARQLLSPKLNSLFLTVYLSIQNLIPVDASIMENIYQLLSLKGLIRVTLVSYHTC